MDKEINKPKSVNVTEDMAAVLRVKRRNSEEPLDALVFACKRKKLNDESDSHSVADNPFTVLKLAATVKSQDEDISVLLPVNDREDIWHSKLNHKVDILKKLRKNRGELSRNSRFKIVNCFRHINSDEGDSTRPTDKQNIIIFDVESSQKDEEKIAERSSKEDDIQFVYDIYYGYTNKEYDFVTLEHLVDIMPYSETMDFGPSNEESDDDILNAVEDEDSNDENNWRNDYPDSDNSINEDDMRLAMQMGGMNLGRESVHSSSDEDLMNEHEADPQDVEYYGEVYAKYKARVQRELHDYDESSNNSNNSFGEELGNESDDEDEDPELRFM